MDNSHGTQGILNTASKGTLENEFGTSNEDDVIKQILQKGDVQTSQVRHEVVKDQNCPSLLVITNYRADANTVTELGAPG